MKTQTVERPTCTNCPYFQDFGESNGRGWCGMFDQIARQQHERTGDCEQEIEALEKESQQQAVLEPKPQLQSAGLAGDSLSCQLQPTQEAKTEFEQGRTHGQQDAGARLHPIYIEATCDYTTGYVEGYNKVLNSTQPEQQQQDTKTLEWSVIYDSKWDWYQVWVGNRCCREKVASYEEGEQIAQRYIATNELIKRQNARVLAAYAC